MNANTAVGFWRAAGTALWLVGTTAGAAAFDINDPEVELGLRRFEAIHIVQAGFPTGSTGNTRHLQTLSYYYGLTSIWQVKGTVFLEQADDERDYRATLGSLENTFELRNLTKHGFGLAWFTGFTGAIDAAETNSVTFGPILKVATGPLVWTFNPFLDQTFGRNHEHGIAFAYGWQVGKEIKDGVTLSLAGFGRIPDIGDPPPMAEQEHKIGPLLTLEHKLDEKRSLSFEVGAFVGLTDATPDAAGKAKITYQY